MGISPEVAQYCLSKCVTSFSQLKDNNVERAIDYAFSHENIEDDILAESLQQQSKKMEEENVV
jgi:hypothetical protein